MKLSKAFLTTAMALVATVALADTSITSFNYGGGTAEIYISSTGGVFVRTQTGTYNTGFAKGSGKSGCDYTSSSGSCVSTSEMINTIKSKTKSTGGYNG